MTDQTPLQRVTEFVEVSQTVPAPAPHRVKVWTVHCINMTDENDHYDEARYDVEHTPQCDALSYDQSCWLDRYQIDAGTHDWPTEPGEYTATLHTWQSFEGEHDARIDFEPVPAAAPEQPR